MSRELRYVPKTIESCGICPFRGQYLQHSMTGYNNVPDATWAVSYCKINDKDIYECKNGFPPHCPLPVVGDEND